MKPTEKIFFLFLFLFLFNAIHNVSHLFLSHFNTKTPFIGKKAHFGPIVHYYIEFTPTEEENFVGKD